VCLSRIAAVTAVAAAETWPLSASRYWSVKPSKVWVPAPALVGHRSPRPRIAVMASSSPIVRRTVCLLWVWVAGKSTRHKQKRPSHLGRMSVARYRGRRGDPWGRAEDRWGVRTRVPGRRARRLACCSRSQRAGSIGSGVTRPVARFTKPPW
jgi:hypothetical protein